MKLIIPHRDQFDLIIEGTSNLKIAIPKDVKDIHKLFKKNRKELYIVGGAVRDSLMKKKPKDFDLATDATPDEVIKILKSGGYKVLELGKSFGVVVALTDQTPEGMEIATFRKEFGKGRRPDSVEFTNIESDVKRRDLTINALFYDIGKEKIVDLVGGVEDIQKRRIRTVGDPKERFEEDALRKLRTLRFAGRTGSKLDPNVDKVLNDNNSLDGVSSERIRSEFQNGVKSSKSARYFLILIEKYGFFPAIFGDLKVNKKFIDTNNWIIQLSELLKNNNDIEKPLNKLTYETDEITNTIFFHFLLTFKDDITAFKKIQDRSHFNEKDLKEWIKVNSLDKKLIMKAINWNITTKGDSLEIKKLGLKGKEIGYKIKEIENKKFNNG